jgi:hypothetical protein
LALDFETRVACQRNVHAGVCNVCETTVSANAMVLGVPLVAASLVNELVCFTCVRESNGLKRVLI